MTRCMLVTAMIAGLLLAAGCPGQKRLAANKESVAAVQPAAPAAKPAPAVPPAPAEKPVAVVRPAPVEMPAVVTPPVEKPAAVTPPAEKPAAPVAKPAVAPAGPIAGVPAGKPVADKKAFAVEPAASAVKVDGVLDEAAWKDAAELGGFVDAGGKPVAVQARLLVTYDQDNLYLAVVNEEPDTAKLKALVTKRGGNIWSDDSDEIYLDPKARKEREFIGLFVNAKNVVYDRTRASGTEWPGGKWDSATGVIDGKAWVVELAVPWKALGMSGKAGDKIGVMVGRNRFAGAERSTMSFLAPCGREAKNTAVYPVATLK